MRVRRRSLDIEPVVPLVPDAAPVVLDRAPARRRRRAVGVVLFAALCGVGGGVVGSQLRSPADAARDRAAPRPSRITVPIERRELVAKLVVAATVEYATPYVVSLAGSVSSGSGDGASNQLVTRVPDEGAPVAEGDVLLEVTGRPVIVVIGSIPTYRTITPGSNGPDVAQLEQALDRLGFAPGTVDDVYDSSTEAAVEAMYAARGFEAVGPTTSETERLTGLDDAITGAESSLRAAQQSLIDAAEPIEPATLLQLQQAIAEADENSAQAQRDAVRNNASADRSLAGADAALALAQQGRNAAANALARAQAAGVADEIAAKQAELSDAETALVDATDARADQVDNRASVAEEGVNSLNRAQRAKDAAAASYRDGTKPKDTTSEQRAVDDAQTALTAAQTAQATAEAEIGISVPAGELVFAPSLPSNVSEVQAAVGTAASGPLVTLSSTASQVVGSVSDADGALVQAGAAAIIDLRDYAVELPATITSIGAPPPAAASDGAGQPAAASTRPRIVADADDPAALSDYVGASTRLVIDIAATGGKVLVVPVAALTVGGDGTTRVEVERAPVTETDDGVTELVTVDVGLTADGLVEIRSDALHEGDRVVVGQAAATVSASAP